jgi:hypothetical protein
MRLASVYISNSFVLRLVLNYVDKDLLVLYASAYLCCDLAPFQQCW